MFSVYGKGGRIFSGALEDLRHSGAINGLARTRRVNAMGQDGADHPVSGFQNLLEQPATTHDLPHKSALAAYAQTQRAEHERAPITHVSVVMSQPALTLLESMRVEEAWKFLQQKGIGQAPVVDADGVLVGLFTRAELMRNEKLPDARNHALVWISLMQQSVGELMISPVPSVTADADIRRVARVLLDTELAGLPVVTEAGQVSAFISRTDILRAVVADPPLDLWT